MAATSTKARAGAPRTAKTQGNNPDSATDPEDKIKSEAESSDLDVPAGADGSVGMYLKQIGKIPLLNAAQEVDLAKRIEAGLSAKKKLAATSSLKRDYRLDLEWIVEDGIRAKHHLLEANLRLVVSIAKRYKCYIGCGMNFLDLIQEGNLGLIRAVEKFDYTMGYKFSTYATRWIHKAIKRAIDDQARTIRIPVYTIEQMEKLTRIIRQFIEENGYEPSLTELAIEMDSTPEEISKLKNLAREPISLHTPIGEDESSVFGDIIEDTYAVEPSDAAAFTLLQEELIKVLAELPERQAMIISMWFGLTDGRPKTHSEISQILGVTRPAISQTVAKAMLTLRDPSYDQRLRDFLD